MHQLPERLAHIIERCLARDPEDRWNSARDIKSELDWAKRTSASASPTQSTSRLLWVAVIGLFFVGVAAVLFGLFSYRQARTADARPVRLAITAPQGANIREGSAISPDGRGVVFVAQSSGGVKLWVRPLDSLTARELPGTEAATYPFWSPDSRFVAFFAAGKLKRIDVNGGVVTVICNVGLGRGGTWNEQGTILFNSVNDGPLLSVLASGGMPVPVTTVDTARQENSHRWPYFLPGGRRFLYYIRAANPDTDGVYLGSLDRPSEKIRLLNSPSNAVFARGRNRDSGYLAWVRDGNLMLQPFDPSLPQVGAEPIALAQNVRFNIAGRNAEISISTDGVLVYGTLGRIEQRLTWFGRDGKPLDMIGQPDAYEGVRISPDGTHIAVTRETTTSQSGRIALLEMGRGIATPLVFGFGFAWSADGQRIAYAWSPSGAPNVYTMPTSGHGDRERLTDSQNSQNVVDWSADKRFILYAEQPNDIAAANKSGLWVLPLADRKASLFVQTAFQQAHAQFSPDGQWIAYTSTESGRAEIYVQSFPAGRAKWQISSNGGDYPRWRRDGRELFYLAPDETLMSAVVQRTAGPMQFAPPGPLFKMSMPGPGLATIKDYPYDVASDGQRILGFTPTGSAEAQTLVVLSGWQVELRNTKP